MGAPERGGRGQTERRRFITRAHVEDAAAAGQPIRVTGRDTITDEAAQRATDLGVVIERDRSGVNAGGHQSAPALAHPPAPAAVAASQDELRSAVRFAVIAELGSEPPGLNNLIDRVLKSRSL